MPRTQLEVERKLDVAADFVLPDLTGVGGVVTADPPVEHALEAVYHDTDDLRLVRARVTLRRRTGGADAGWHLKLPAGTGARREVHEPLGRATRTAPKALRSLVLGITRGAPTAPVATLRTRRLATVVRDADGRAVAEVADDTVVATVPATAPGEAAEQLTWREVEVELVDGDLPGGEALLARLCERLLAGGARPAAAASKIGRVLAGRLPAAPPPPGKQGKQGKQGKRRRTAAGPVVVAALTARLADLHDADLLVRTGGDEGVHDVRVACRRLRSVLAAYRPVLDRAATDPVRAELRWLGEQLSAARDGEVALAHLRDLVAAQPPELVPGPVAARLQQSALREEAAGRARAQATLADPRYLRLLDALHALVGEPPLAGRAGDPAEEVLRDAVRRGARRLLDRMSDATSDADGSPRADAALHEVRKAAKRLRYTAEVAQPTRGRRTAELVGCLQQVQDVLGAHQDSGLTRERCVRLGREAFAAGENPWAFGRLHGLEEGRAERARAAFRDLGPVLHPVLERARKKG